MTDFEKVNITMKASVTFRGTGDDLKVKMKELKVRNLVKVCVQRVFQQRPSPDDEYFTTFWSLLHRFGIL